MVNDARRGQIRVVESIWAGAVAEHVCIPCVPTTVEALILESARQQPADVGASHSCD